MVKFAYNNTKNASTNHMFFKLNCSYYPRISYKEKINFCSKSRSMNKLLEDLRELMIIYQKNLYHI